MTSRESHFVELVDTDGTAAGSTTVDEAHQAPGQLHRAFSVFLRVFSGALGGLVVSWRPVIHTISPSNIRIPT